MYTLLGTLSWNVVQGCSTLVIAVIGLSIAYWQAKNADSRAKLDLFDRRFALYQRVMLAGEVVLTAQDNADQVLNQLLAIASDSKFLFDSPVRDHITDLAFGAGTLVGDRSLKNHTDFRQALIDLDEIVMPYFDLRTVGRRTSWKQRREASERRIHPGKWDSPAVGLERWRERHGTS